MKHHLLPCLFTLLLLFSLLLASIPVSALTVIESMDGEPEMVPILGEDGEPLLGADGEELTEQAWVQAKDEFGQLLYDDMGNPIMEPSYLCLWEGAETDPLMMAEGSGCITSSTEGGEVRLVYRPQTTINISDYAPDFVFDLWVYAEVPERMTTATLTVRDAQGGQVQWNLHEAMTKVGWNHLTCPVSTAIENNLNPRVLSSVTLTFAASGPNVFKADLLRVGAAPEFGLGRVQIKTDSPTYRMLERFDGGTARVLDGEYDPTGMVEGEACLSSISGLGLGAVAVRFEEAIDLHAYAEDGYLYLWLWVEDASKVGDGVLLFSSAEDPEQSASGYRLSDLGLHDGWNELLLPLSMLEDGLGKGDGVLDIRAVTCFAVYATRQEVGLRVDALQVGMREDFIGEPTISAPEAPPETTPPESTPPETTPPETNPPVTNPLPPDTVPGGSDESGVPADSENETNSESGAGGTEVTDTQKGEETDGEIPPQLIAVGIAMVLLIFVVLLAAGLDRGSGKKKSQKKKKKKTAAKKSAAKKPTSRTRR